MDFRFMTYNIAGARDYTRYERRINKKGQHWIYAPVDTSKAGGVVGEFQPDICGLNEVDYFLPRSGRIDIASQVGKVAGDYSSYFGKAITWEQEGLSGEYGNALLSKHRVVSLEIIPVEEPEDRSEPTYYEQRSIMHAIIDMDSTFIEVIHTHFGLAKLERANAVKIIIELIKNRKYPLILSGDLNVEWFEEDLKEIRELLVDTFDAYKGPTPVFTFRKEFKSDITEKHLKEGYKIDYIFVSNEFKTTNVIIPERDSSDHYPYIVDLSI